MKILIAAPMPPQQQAPGAIPLVLHAQLTGLRARNEVTLVVVAGPNSDEIEAVKQLQATGLQVEAVKRTSLRGLDRWKRRWRLGSGWLQGKIPWRSLWFWEPTVQHVLDRLLARENYDLLLVEDNAMGMYQYHTNAPKIFTEHEVRRPRPVDWGGLRENNFAQWIFTEADWSRWPRYQVATWTRFDLIQAFSPRDAQAIRSLCPELASRVRVNPFGIDLPKPLEIQKEQTGELLFVGNFTHPPNVDAALWLGREIMPQIRAICPEVHLTLVGSSPPDAVKELSCEDILVTGEVPAIEPYFERAAIVLAPLRIGGGMRMKVLQAMALGKAVVSTARGADGLAVEGGDPPVLIAENSEEFTAATFTLLANSNKRYELGCQARAFVAQHYSAEAYARRIELVYEDLQSVQK